MTSTVPERLGHYVIERELGAGAMGVVFLARDERLDRRVALKSLPPHFADDEERLARFEREARMLAALHHPHVASLFGLEEIDGRRYLVMEFVEGETLADRIARGPIDLDEALELGEQIGLGLAAAHDRGIIHRDLKPGNVLVTPDGRAKVVDFGLAKDVTPAASVDTGLFTGSGSFQEPPEGEAGTIAPTVAMSERPDVTRVSAGGRRGHGTGDGSGDDGMPDLDAPTVPKGAGAAETSAGVLATAPGEVLGTAAYMSPEQARGRPLDRRCDVWAFGCVLYEMLTRRRPFPGRTLTETLMAVLQKSPDWSLLPAGTPPALRRLLERSLRKDPKERLRDLGDAALELRELRSVAWEIDQEPARAARSPVALAGLVAGVLLAALGFWLLAGDAPQPVPVRFSYPAPALDWGQVLDNNLAVAPGGGSWVYRVADDSGGHLVLRSLDSLEPETIPGTEGARNPFWSPDGRHLGFTADGEIRRLEPFESSPRTVVGEIAGDIFGTPSWGADDSILFTVLHSETPEASGVFRVPAEGGEPRQVLGARELPDAAYVGWPEHLPDPQRFVFLAGKGDSAERRLFLADVDGGEPRPVEGVASRAVSVAPDRLLFVHGTQLLAQAFDAEAARMAGEPAILASGLAVNEPTGAAGFGASADLLVTVHRSAERRMQWFDAESGQPLDSLGEPAELTWPRISPDGEEVVVAMAESPGEPRDLWIFDLDRGIPTRLTATPGQEGRADWSPDGERLVYFDDAANPPDVRIRRAHAGGESRLLVGGPGPTFPSDWSPDGEHILYETFPEQDLYLAPVDGSAPRPWLVAPGAQNLGRFSPDGRFVAFNSSELGRMEVFLAPREDSGPRQRVSARGGRNPVWSPSGERIFFHHDREILAVAVDPVAGRVDDRPEPVVRLTPPDHIASFDVSPDGERFLLSILDEDRERPRITARVGWARQMED